MDFQKYLTYYTTNNMTGQITIICEPGVTFGNCKNFEDAEQKGAIKYDKGNIIIRVRNAADRDKLIKIMTTHFETVIRKRTKHL